MLAKEAKVKSCKVAGATFWKERALWLECIHKAASRGDTAVVRNNSINPNVVLALEVMGYKVRITTAPRTYQVYTRVSWSHAQI